MRRGWSMWDSATGGFRAWAADQGGKCGGGGDRMGLRLAQALEVGGRPGQRGCGCQPNVKRDRA